MERKVIRRVLAAVTFVAAALLYGSARADDYGPKGDVAAIRHDIPIIYAHGIHGSYAIDDVVVSGNDALVQWHVSQYPRLEVMKRMYDRWWVVSEADVDPAHPCALSGLRMPQSLQALGAAHVPALQASPPPAISKSTRGRLIAYGCDFMSGRGPLDSLSFDNPTTITGDGYSFTLTPAYNDSPEDALAADFQLRKPTEAESWMVRGGNSYVFFSTTIQASKPFHVPEGTKIDVCFPFALPPEKKYSLTIGYTDEPIGPIDGTLRDNTLHFVLPAFSVKPGAHLIGEIDGD